MNDDSDNVSDGLAAGELQSRALRGVSWSSVSAMIYLPVAIVASAIVARALGPQEFARFAYLGVIIPLMWMALDAGFSAAMSRAVSGAFAAGDVAGTRVLLGKAVGWHLLRLPILCAVTIFVARPEGTVTWVLIGAMVINELGSGLAFSLSAENRGAVTAKLAFVGSLAVAAVSVSASLAGATGTTVWALAFAAGALSTIAWYPISSPRLRRAALRPRLPHRMPARFWRFSIAALATSLGYALVFQRSEVMLLELFEQEQALAVFALAFGLAQRLTTPVDTMLGPLILAFSALDRAHPRRLQAGFERALRLSCLGVAFLAGAALVGTIFAAPILYGDEYGGVGLAFAALALTSMLQSASHPYTALASGLGRPAIVLRALVAALVVDVTIALVLIPTLGLWGAIIANVAGAAVAISLSARAVAGRASLRKAGVPVLRLLCVAGGAAGLAYLAAVVATAAVAPIAGVVAAYVVGAVAFILGARSVDGLLSAADATVILRAVPRRLEATLRFLTSSHRPACENTEPTTSIAIEKTPRDQEALGKRGGP